MTTRRKRDEYGRSVIENRISIGAFIVGGATVITGTVLLFINRPQSYRNEDQDRIHIELFPAVSGNAASLSARLVS